VKKISVVRRGLFMDDLWMMDEGRNSEVVEDACGNWVTRQL